jgi:hypothetical protein
MSLFRCLDRSKDSVQVRGVVCEYFVTKIHFHSQELLAPRPTPKLEDHPLSAVRDYLFKIFAATLHIGGRSSSCNPMTHHAVVTGTHLQHDIIYNNIASLFTIYATVWSFVTITNSIIYNNCW